MLAGFSPLLSFSQSNVDAVKFQPYTPHMNRKRRKPPENETCLCCGFTRPRTDEMDSCPVCFTCNEWGAARIASQREQWISDGMLWRSAFHNIPAPMNWNPLQTLASLALKTTKARTRGRRPRPIP